MRSIGSRKEEITIAQHLYSILRDFDESDISVIYSESFETPKIGQAIMNRLIKAAGHQILVSRVIGVKKIEQEVLVGEAKFRRKKIFNFMIRYLCPIFAAIILISSVANAFGWIKM